jgi:hypothetical protein
MTIGEYAVAIVAGIGVGAYLYDFISQRQTKSNYTTLSRTEPTTPTATYDEDTVAWSIFHELLEKTEAGKIKWDYIYPDKLSESKSIYKHRVYSAVKNRVKVVVDQADITLDGTVMCNAWDVPNFDKLRNAICTYCDREDERKVMADEERIYNKFKGKKK